MIYDPPMGVKDKFGVHLWRKPALRSVIAEVPFFIRQTLDAYRLANPNQRGVY